MSIISWALLFHLEPHQKINGVVFFSFCILINIKVITSSFEHKYVQDINKFPLNKLEKINVDDNDIKKIHYKTID